MNNFAQIHPFFSGESLNWKQTHLAIQYVLIEVKKLFGRLKSLVFFNCPFTDLNLCTS